MCNSMTTAEAVRTLGALVEKSAKDALANGDLGKRAFLFSRAAVLGRLAWVLNDEGPAFAFRFAWQWETADREDVPADIWAWMSQYKNTDVVECALAALGALVGARGSERYVHYGDDLGAMPACTHSEVGGLVRELERFLP